MITRALRRGLQDVAGFAGLPPPSKLAFTARNAHLKYPASPGNEGLMSPPPRVACGQCCKGQANKRVRLSQRGLELRKAWEACQGWGQPPAYHCRRAARLL